MSSMFYQGDIALGILLALVVLVAGVLWLVRFRGRPRATAGPEDSDVPVPLRRGPHPVSGAVALEEPDDGDKPDLIGRKL